MWKIAINILLLITLSGNAFADHWHRNRRYYGSYPRYSNYRYYNNISPGAATAIGLGTGIVGYVIGRSVSNTHRDNSRIECKEFDIKVNIDGEEKKAKITKCRTEDGDWKIPD